MSPVTNNDDVMSIAHMYIIVNGLPGWSLLHNYYTCTCVCHAHTYTCTYIPVRVHSIIQLFWLVAVAGVNHGPREGIHG